MPNPNVIIFALAAPKCLQFFFHFDVHNLYKTTFYSEFLIS